ISEFDLAKLSGGVGAYVTLPSLPDRRIDILASGGRLVNVGKVVDPQTRTVTMIYEMPNKDGLFRVGMFAEVHVETQKAIDAVAITEEAIVMDNGRPIAFVLVGGESFQRRELELGVGDSGFVEVKSGVKLGERVITKGAYAVKLAAQSPASFGAGHGH
ncbi:MAG: efflux RND transporter periplasmic adaptor subunit, partial [Planctomycetota bacterium]